MMRDVTIDGRTNKEVNKTPSWWKQRCFLAYPFAVQQKKGEKTLNKQTVLTKKYFKRVINDEIYEKSVSTSHDVCLAFLR